MKKHLAGGALALLASIALLAPVPAAAGGSSGPPPSPIHFGPYPNLCLAPAGLQPGYRLLLAACDNAADQQWTWVGAAGSAGQILFWDPGPYAASTALSSEFQDAGVLLYYWDSTDPPSQMWYRGGPTYFLTNPDGSRWCLTAPNSTQGSLITVERCVDGYLNQQWAGP